MNEIKRFKDRLQAGKLLAERLSKYADHSEVVLLALPRGGVPVGFAIAEELNLPLDVFMVGKLGVPGQKEYAMGAVAVGGQSIIQSSIVNELDIPQSVINEIIQSKLEELTGREKLYRANHPPLKIGGRIVILVDDGLATGLTMLLAVQSVRKDKPAHILVAVPVAPKESIGLIEAEADEVVCLSVPGRFHAVGQWYDDFNQVSDDEVMHQLEKTVRLQERRIKNLHDPQAHNPDEK